MRGEYSTVQKICMSCIVDTNFSVAYFVIEHVPLGPSQLAISVLRQPFGEHHHSRDATMLRSPRARSDAVACGLCLGNVWLLTKPMMNKPQTRNAYNIVLITEDGKQDAKY